MSVSAGVEVYGIKDALKELNTIDKKLRRQITKDYKQIVSSVIQDAKASVPSSAPLSGMNRRWQTKSGHEIIPTGGWNEAMAQKWLQAKISTRKVKEFRGTKVNVGTFRIVWAGLANSVYDMTGRKSVGAMAQALNAKYGSASRLLWPAYEKNKSQVDDQMLKLCDQVMHQVNRNLVVNKPTS